MWLSEDHGRLIKWHPLVNFRFANLPFEKRILQKKVFSMFSGKKVLEDLRCDNSLMKTMLDRFGEDVTDQYQTGRSAYLRLGQLFMRLFAGLL